MTFTSQSSTILKRLVLHAVLILISIVVAIFLIKSNSVHTFLEHASTFDLLGSFIAGIFFTSTFTAAPATATLFIIGESQNSLIVSLIAAAGSVIGDAILSKIIKRELHNEAYSLIIPKNTRAIRKILHTPMIYWFIATIAIVIIASPLPDELGISMLNIIHFKTHHFLLISFVVNFLGILCITSIARVR